MLKSQKSIHQSQGFTLLELLIVIGILAVLGGVTFLVLNPVERMNQTKDNRRLVELSGINKALQVAAVQGVSNFGQANRVYVSLSSNNSDCSDLGLPSLPGGWAYRCSSQTNYRNVNGSGWIPVDFFSLATGAPFSVLPIDPINTPASGFYYTYTVSGNSWELTSILKTTEYQQRYASNDGGQSDTAAEIGTKLKITPLAVVTRSTGEGVIIVTYDFESGEQGWSHGIYDGGIDWALATAFTSCYNDLGTTAMINEQCNNSVNDWLKSPIIDLSQVTNPSLVLKVWQSDEDGGCYDGGSWDSKDLRICQDDGMGGETNCTVLACSWNNDGAWHEYNYDISSYAGYNNVILMFRYITRDSCCGETGWAVDDIRITY